MKPLIYSLISALIIAGCAFGPAGLAPSIEPLPNGNYKVIEHVKGIHSYVSIFGVIPTERPDYNKAIKDALKNQPEGSTLINVRAYNKTTCLYLVFIHTLIVEGDVVLK